MVNNYQEFQQFNQDYMNLRVQLLQVTAPIHLIINGAKWRWADGATVAAYKHHSVWA